jgi:glycosyltransferase involved in cell wall biosynthesis
MTQLSCYILTFNSEKYLTQILSKAQRIADEILIVDSGSTDHSLEIAFAFGCKILKRPLDNFRAQRTFAINNCTYNWVLSFDSDEIPSKELVNELLQIKQKGFQFDAYTIKREWIVLGKKVHAVYPVVCPDYPVRLFNRTKVFFDERSNAVHETPHGYTTLYKTKSPLLHQTFETKQELRSKLDFYTSIAAKQIIDSKKKAGLIQLIINPVTAFIKWYLLKGNFKDGITGLLLAKYACNYTFLKYHKAILLQKR